MVAVASRPVDAPGARRSPASRPWIVAAAAALVIGAGLRLALGTGGAGDRAAAVMAILLGLVVWIATMLVGTPRTGFFSAVGLMVLLDLAALPARPATEFDDRAALFKTDQVISARLPVRAAGVQVLTVVAEQVFSGPQPTFGLSGEVGGAAVGWQCPPT
ncbi:MAG TPA: hypothetical protein VGQ62_12755, partial [Chloroflexota bacterium]|nr:hypothetical protein [Chloroflexota bacterium]